MQDRIFKESVQSISGMVFAISLFAQGNDKAASTTKTVTQSLLAGVGAANATEFAFFGIGKSLSGLPGIVGRFGGALSNLGGPIGIALGVGAALITFFQQTNAEAKKAADEGLKMYADAIERAVSAMDKLTPKQAKFAEGVLRAGLAETEAKLEVYRLIQEQMKSGGQSLTISEEQAKRAGLTDSQLGAMTPSLVEEMIKNLREQQVERAAQLLALGSGVTGGSGGKKVRLPGPPQLYGPDKPGFIDQEYEAGLRALEKEMEKRERFEEKLAALREQIENRVAAAREASWQRDVSAVENLGSVLQSSFNIASDTFLGKMLKALQIATQIARALRFAGTEEGSGLGGILGVVSSFIPGLGLLFGGASSAGIGTSEAVNRAYAPGASGGGTSIQVSGRVDLSNGKLFLIQEMPAYSNHLANKTV
jgi:hypothetical protein